MTSISNTIIFIEKHLQNVLNQEDIEKNILVINESINNLKLDVPIREFLVRLIKLIKLLSESKANFPNYPLTEENNSLHKNSIEELKQNTEVTIKKLNDEINKIISVVEIKDFGLILNNTINQLTAYIYKMKEIIELLLSENNKKSHQILKWENLVVEVNEELKTFKIKYDTEIENNKKLKKSNDELKSDMKDMKLKSLINKVEIKTIKKDNILINDEIKKAKHQIDQINDENDKLKNENQKMINEIILLKNHNERSDNKFNQIFAENKIMENKILLMEKHINELKTNFIQQKNIDNYYHQKELEEVKKQKLELEKSYSSKLNEIDNIVKIKVNEELTKYTLNENIASFVNNRDNFKAIIYIFLIANGENIDDLKKK